MTHCSATTCRGGNYFSPTHPPSPRFQRAGGGQVKSPPAELKVAMAALAAQFAQLALEESQKREKAQGAIEDEEVVDYTGDVTLTAGDLVELVVPKKVTATPDS